MSEQAEWWRTFFSGPVVEIWLGATGEAQTQAEIQFVVDALQAVPPARLLDVPCGGGRHAAALAERGYHVTGVDVSDEFLQAARARAAPKAGSTTWEHRDMRDLPWTGTFQGAYCLGNSFGYLDDDGNRAFLQAVCRALEPGARFVLETGYVLECLLPTLQERAWYPFGDMLMLAERRYDPPTGRLHVEYRHIKDGCVDRRAMSARLLSCREILALLHDVGFVDVEIFSSFDRAPFRLGSPRLLAVARRPPGIAG